MAAGGAGARPTAGADGGRAARGDTGRRCLPAARVSGESHRQPPTPVRPGGLVIGQQLGKGAGKGATGGGRRARSRCPALGDTAASVACAPGRFSVCHAARGVTNASPAASGARPGATLREESGCSPAAGRLATSALPAWASPPSPTGGSRSAGSRGSFGDSHPRGWLCVWGIRGTRGASKPPRRLLRRLPLTCYLCKAFAPTAQDLIHVNRGVTTWRSAYFLRVCVMENMRPVSSEAEVLTRQVYSSGNVYRTFLAFAFPKRK